MENLWYIMRQPSAVGFCLSCSVYDVRTVDTQQLDSVLHFVWLLVPSRFPTENQDLLESVLTVPYKCSLGHIH